MSGSDFVASRREFSGKMFLWEICVFKVEMECACDILCATFVEVGIGICIRLFVSFLLWTI